MSTVVLFRVAPATAHWLRAEEGALHGVTLELTDDESALVERIGAPRSTRRAEVDAGEVVVIGEEVDEPERVVERLRAQNAHVAIVWIGHAGVAPDDRAALMSAIRDACAETSHRALRTSYDHERTRRKRVEAELEALRKGGREEARHDRILASVAHDIRAPLAVISGATAEMGHPSVGVLNEEQNGLVALVHKSVERLKRLAANLVAFGSLKDGHAELTRRRVDIAQLARLALASIVELDGRRVELRADLPREPVIVQGDAEKIALLLSNMLSNAMRCARSEVRLRIVSAGKTARIEVEDDGEALPDDAMGDAFGHTEASTSRSATGLGSVLVRGIVAAHGGTARAERVMSGTSARGARFVVSLPTHESVDHHAVH